MVRHDYHWLIRAWPSVMRGAHYWKQHLSARCPVTRSKRRLLFLSLKRKTENKKFTLFFSKWLHSGPFVPCYCFSFLFFRKCCGKKKNCLPSESRLHLVRLVFLPIGVAHQPPPPLVYCYNFKSFWNFEKRFFLWICFLFLLNDCLQCTVH